MSEHAIIITTRVSSITPDLSDISALCDELHSVLLSSNNGECDGHEISDDGLLKIYLYGPDASVMFFTVEGILRSSPLLSVCEITKRYGAALDQNAKEEFITIG